MDVLPPKSNKEGYIRIVLWIPESANEKFLKLCGVDAVLTDKYIMSDEDRNFFAVVPLVGATREEALKRAEEAAKEVWPLKTALTRHLKRIGVPYISRP